MGTRVDNFRRRLIDREAMIGTFQKTPSSVVAEILGLTDLDAVCIDTEHAPFGRLELDQSIAALRAADKPNLVRTADDSPREIRNALDSGATGIVVPHVTTADQARAIVKASHFGDQGRGYAGSPRAADYTIKSMADHIADSRDHTTVIVQIDGVDCLFIGRADLSVAMQKSMFDEEIIDIVTAICASGQKASTAVGMFTPDTAEIPAWRAAGASLFLLSSDQSMLLAGAKALTQTIE